MEILKLILNQSRLNFHLGIAIKLFAITKEPCPSFSVNHVIPGTTQLESTLMEVFSLCWKGLSVSENVLTVAFSATLFDSVILDSDISLASSEESPLSSPPPAPLLSSSPSEKMQPIQSLASNLRIVAINIQSACAKKEEFWCLIDAAKPMSSLVVKHGIGLTLAILKSFHLAILSTEKIELMGMEVCFWASQPALTAIKLKLKRKANLWLLKC